ncbi:expressed unknown protein [Seminavis robusta]|uniref:Amino acid transporter transmembrane domain-containing protein n=1 Tax=Seminavis robusta TaxID=568900 RepID=A0A9N8HKC1_9STRA|nr:expressed unknown protein [Seminavis robusta]|eukprot:Sro932_g221610.1 n/a (442) ;mRNA; r:15210-16985
MGLSPAPNPLAVCCAENVASDYVLSAMARAEWLLGRQDQEQREEDQEALVTTASKDYGSILDTTTTINSSERILVIGSGRCPLDLPEVCQLFLGRIGYTAYMISVHLYLYGSLWMFTAVFGNAVAEYYFDSNSNSALDLDHYYQGAILGLTVLVLPLSCLQLTEQKLLQVLLTASRMLLMILMVATPLWAAITGTSHFGDMSMDEDSNQSSLPLLVDWRGIHRMLPIVVCAAIFHFSIPALATDLGRQNQDQLSHIFAWTMVLVFVVYASIGVTDALYFGGANNIRQSSNVNWAHYHGGTGRPIIRDDGVTIWIDVACVFPLHALVLGNSLMAVWYKDRTNPLQQNRWIISAFRIVAAVPPLIGGLYVRELGTILDYNGIFGLAIAFVFPAWLYLSSTERCPSTIRTAYDRLGSSYPAAKSLLVFGVLAQVTVFSLLVWRG